MKTYLYPIFILLLCISCTNTFEESPDYCLQYNSEPIHKISESQALNIAESFWYNKAKARTSQENPLVNYVIKSSKASRIATELPDTLAYIFNYQNDNGFTIVAADNRLSPILAYSNEGTFSFDNEIVTENFISNISLYMSAEISKGQIYKVDTEKPESCVQIYPKISESIGQSYPYNKYVILEHPDCPAGCVAVATANVMIQTLNSKVYHNSHFEFAAIRQIFKEKNPPTPEQPNRINRIVGPTYPPANPLIKYTYEEAKDSIAKMLYWIGKDLNMTYTKKGSSAFSSDAYALLKQLKFDIIHPDLVNYNISDICHHINNNCIVYMRGRAPSAGHAWVCDGCSFCINDDGTTFNEYVYCDWGWNGLSNGYYNGDVFEAAGYAFSGMTYFAVKRHLSQE